MNPVQGSSLRGPLQAECDVVVVGSGPAGAAVARSLQVSGAKVLVLEEGPLVNPSEMVADAFGAMAALYRDMGASVMFGSPPIPYLQGRAVGGTSVINGAISWRMPRDVYDAWVAADPPLGEKIPWEEVERETDAMERDLSIAPTEDRVAGPKNLLMAKGAEALGLEHRPISRNVRGCKGLGRCLQGCPEGLKTSMDLTLLPEAERKGAQIWSEVRARRILVERGRARGVEGTASGGGRITVLARRAVVLAASAIQTPLLLMESGIRGGPVGNNLQCHPGSAVGGRFKQAIRAWEGATQGHEVIGLRKEGLKFEVLGYDIGLYASRLKGVGKALAEEIADIEHVAHWGVAIRSTGRGKVRPGPRVSFQISREDVVRARRGIRVLCELMLAAGADHVVPGVHGFDARITDRAALERLEKEGPLDARAYSFAATHLFGTCRMGSDPVKCVVRPDFRHHRVDGLYLADSSVFPTNTGVNPQTSILALAAVCARRIASR